MQSRVRSLSRHRRKVLPWNQNHHAPSQRTETLPSAVVQTGKLLDFVLAMCYCVSTIAGDKRDPVLKTMKALLLAVNLALLGYSGASTAWGTVATFDELDETGALGGAGIPNGYQGLIWNGGSINTFEALNAILLTNAYPQNGWFNGMVTKSNVAYNAFGSPAEIDSVGGTRFTFYSAYLTAAWYNNLSVEVQGFSGTNLIYDQTNVVHAISPTLVNYNFQNVTRLYFNAFGGQGPYGEADGPDIFAMDNFSFVFGAGAPGLAPFAVTAVTIQGTNVLLTWTVPQGTTNVVQAASGGAGGSYSTNFLDISPVIIIPGTNTTVGVTTNYIDVAGTTNRPARYYRVRYAP
jgi:hypothetical protein